MSTCYKGITWGQANFSETTLRLTTISQNPKSLFGIQFEAMNNAAVNKNDIIIETGAQIQNEEDCMCEIRFHVQIPKQDNEADEENQSDSDNQEKQKKEENNNNKEENEEDKEKKQNHTQMIYRKILQKAKIGSFGGESIITLNEVNLTVPRGKYTMDFYQKNFRFHGQTYNFVIDYRNITKGFLLPMQNQSQVSIILQLHKDKPIYQGQTLYRYIVIQVRKDIEVQTKSRLKDKDKEKFPNLNQIKQQYEGPLFQVIMDIVRATAQITLIAPDSRDFKSKSGQSCVKCGVKTQSGWLYFLKKSLIFITKPVIYFKTDEIKKVEFNRLGANNKQFDMRVTLAIEKKAVEFMGIQRNQLQCLLQYFKVRNVKLEMEEEVKVIKPQMGPLDDDEDDEEDEDFDGAEDDSEDDSFSEVDESGPNGTDGKKKQKKDKEGSEQKQKQKQKQKPQEQ